MKKRLTEKEIKKIAKKAKARAYDTSLEAMTLYQILTNIGGPFGLICRHLVGEYGEIEQASCQDEEYVYLKWLPSHLHDWLIAKSQSGLVKASFITHQGSCYDQHWHIVADSAKKVVIETKVRRWCKSEEGKRFIARNDHRGDTITSYHWL